MSIRTGKFPRPSTLVDEEFIDRDKKPRKNCRGKRLSLTCGSKYDTEVDGKLLKVFIAFSPLAG